MGRKPFPPEVVLEREFDKFIEKMGEKFGEDVWFHLKVITPEASLEAKCKEKLTEYKDRLKIIGNGKKKTWG